MTGNGLRCFGGEAAPVVVVDGWNRFRRFPEEARGPFLELVIPVLFEPANPAVHEMIRTFAGSHDLREADVSAALQAVSMLFSQVGGLDLGADDLRADLVALSGGESPEIEACLSPFDAMKKEVRSSILLGTLTDHGKVVVGVDWRVDEVTASDRGTALATSVVFLTLRYQDGERLERISLQLTPDAMMQLKSFTDRFGR